MRVGAGLDAAGELQREPMERALETIELFAHFCRAMGIDDVRPVATSAIRDATNRDDFLRGGAQALRARGRGALARRRRRATATSPPSTRPRSSDGVALDLGGGSLQLSHVEDREARDMRSWPLGAVRMTERFLAGDSVKRKQLKALRAHVVEELASAGWLGDAGHDGARLAGIGGTVRNLAAAAEIAAELPSFGVQGFLLKRAALDKLVERFADMTSAERGEVPGIKPERGDLILAGAVVVQTVMEIGAFDALEVTEAGLREGVFYSTLLEGRDPPLFEDVRRDAVLNLAAHYDADFAHVEHVARLALGMWDALGEARVHPCDPRERDLLWAAAMLHDIGTAVDYDDHHKHSRYLILNAGLPGYTTRETALIGQMARYHRKGKPSLGMAARARARRRRGGARALRGAAAGRRAARALARPGGARGARRRGRRARRPAARGRRGRHGRPLGRRAPARPLRARVRAGADGQRGSLIRRPAAPR